MGRASPIWSLGFATRRLSGAVRGGLREEEVERRGGTSFADLVTGLRDEAVERRSGTRLSRTGLRRSGLRDEAAVCGFAGFVVFFSVMVFVGLLGLRWINGVC